MAYSGGFYCVEQDGFGIWFSFLGLRAGYVFDGESGEMDGVCPEFVSQVAYEVVGAQTFAKGAVFLHMNRKYLRFLAVSSSEMPISQMPLINTPKCSQRPNMRLPKAVQDLKSPPPGKLPFEGGGAQRRGMFCQESGAFCSANRRRKRRRTLNDSACHCAADSAG